MDVRKLRFYIFDLYGTLVDIHTEEGKKDLWEKMSVWYQERGADYDPCELRRKYRYEIRRQKRALTAVMPMAEYTEVRLDGVFYHLFSAKGVSPSAEEIRDTGWYFRRLSTERIGLYPGAKELLQGLKKQGKVFLLTNAQSLFTRPELDELGLTDCFDGIYISSDYFCRKPDEQFFRTLLAREKIPLDEAVMIGNDESCDVQGAKRAGLHAIYLHSNLSPRFRGSGADLILDPLNLEKLAQILNNKE